MNPQFPAQYYPTTVPQQQLTAEQLKALKKQQDAFLEQQKKYLLQQQELQRQQQELQKQQMREEQRNKLKNMNVRTMGANLALSQPQQPRYNNPGQYQPQHSFNQGNVGYQHNQQTHNQGYPVQQGFMPTQQGLPVPNQVCYSMPYNQVQSQSQMYQPLENSMNQFQPPVHRPATQMQPPVHRPTTQMQPQAQRPATQMQPLAPTSFGPVSSSFTSSAPLQPFPIQHIMSSQHSLQPQVLSQPSSNTSSNSNNNLLSDPQTSADDDFGDFESVPSSQPSQLFNLLSQTSSIPASSTRFSMVEQNISVITTNPLLITDPGDSSVSHFFNDSDLVSEPKSEDDSFGDFAAFADASISVASTFIPSSPMPNFAAMETPAVIKTDSLIESLSELQTPSPMSNILNLGSIPKAQEEDDFGDFASSRGSTPRPASDYIPGQLDLHEDLSSPHSVEIYSNPVLSKQKASDSKSEFDMLIEKSLSGKPASLPAKSLFKAPARKAVPSSQQTFKESKNSVNWSSLDFGGVFESPAAKNISHDLAGLDLSTNADLSVTGDLSNEHQFFTSGQDDGDDFGDFSAVLSTSNNHGFPLSSQLPSSSPMHKSNSAPFFDVSNLVGIVTPDEHGSIFDVAEPVMNNTNDWLALGESEEPMLVTTDNDLLSIVSQLTNPVKKPLVRRSSKEIDHSKIPSIYRDIVEFCNTPSGIVDVSKVYEVMVTPKFKLVMLQPLMNQCNMASGPSSNDLVHLIGIVGLKQKGFPTPSKYELDFNRLPIPLINSAPMRNKSKSNESEKKAASGTLLSFVNANNAKNTPVSQPPQQSSDTGLTPVFDFDNSSGVDFLSSPIMKTDECVEAVTSIAPPTQPYLGLTTLRKEPETNLFDVPDNIGGNNNNWGNFSTTTVFQQSNNQPSPSLLDSTPSLFDSLPVPNILDQSPVFDPTSVSGEFASFNISKAFHTISSENNASKTVASRTNIPAAAMDEPPSQWSDDDDDDWADFAHPAEKWAIDPDEVDESKLTVNRWGGEVKVVKLAQDTSFAPDKDLSHVMADVELAPQPSRDEVLASPDLDDSFEDFQDASSTVPPGPVALLAGSVPDVNSSSASRDRVLDFVPQPPRETAFSTPSKDTLLSSPETSHPLDETFNPFDDFAEAKPSKDELYWDEPASFSNDVPVTKALSPFSDEVTPVSAPVAEDTFSPFDDIKDRISDDEFADFQSTKKNQGDTFSPFDDFDDEGETPELEENPLALKNLPKKSLDGFWDEMVGTLETEKREPVSTMEVSKKPVMNQAETLFKEPPKYDAFKEETEDNSWNMCLSNGLSIIRQCEKLLRRAANENVLHEVIKSDPGKQYILCCVEIYRVASRINISDTSDDCLMEIYKEIKHIWTMLAEILDDHYDLPTIHDFNISRNADGSCVIAERLCGVCLLDTGCDNKSGILSYNGRSYHAACANFWINTITPTLPNLNVPRMVEPLL